MDRKRGQGLMRGSVGKNGRGRFKGSSVGKIRGRPWQMEKEV